MKIRRSTIVLVVMWFTSVPWSFGQITAGSVPAGMSITDPNVNLSISTNDTEANMAFDIDCDGINDINVLLNKGFTAVDAPNSARFEILNPSYEICADTGSYNIPKYYDLGDSLICKGDIEWYTSSIILLGNYGCFGCFGPAAITDMYIAYRNGSQEGWIKISFAISDAGVPANTITLSIPEVLSPCITNSLQSISSDHEFYLSPNPTIDGKVTINSQEMIHRIQIVNLNGQIVKDLETGKTEITLPEQRGVYIVRAWGENNRFWQRKVLRQ